MPTSFVYLIIWDKQSNLYYCRTYHLERVSRLQCGEKRVKQRRWESQKTKAARLCSCSPWELLTLPLFVTVGDTLCQFLSFYPIKIKSSSELFYLWVYFIQLIKIAFIIENKNTTQFWKFCLELSVACIFVTG